MFGYDARLICIFSDRAAERAKALGDSTPLCILELRPMLDRPLLEKESDCNGIYNVSELAEKRQTSSRPCPIT